MVDRQGWKILSLLLADFSLNLIQAECNQIRFKVLASFSKLFYKWEQAPAIYRNANQDESSLFGKSGMLFLNKIKLMQQVTGVALSFHQASMEYFKRLFPVALIERFAQ